MSEYQYYEFRTIDRPLGEADRRALRTLSTRARITATSFTNSYEWGDFKGDPDELMEQWFDLHLYLANWGTHRLIIKLPAQMIDRRGLDAFLEKVDCAVVRAVGAALILDITRDELDVDDDWDEEAGWLAALAPLRGELLSGDLRLLYLLWLIAVEDEVLQADEPEPLSGIGPMTEALETFAAFFGIDPDLVEAASEADILPDSRRTVGELRARALAIRRARERTQADKAAAERKRREREAEKARRMRLDAIIRQGDGVWCEIESEIERRNAAGYDKAMSLLFDLKTIAEEQGSIEEFQHRLRAIRENHARKGRFIERLAALG